MRLLLLALVAPALLACARTSRHHDTGRPSPASCALDSTLRAAVAAAGIVGAGTAVIVDGRVVWTRAYGMADRERARPLTPRTVMNLGSIAKTAIGVHWGVWQLTDEAIDAPPRDLRTALDAAGVGADRFVALEPGRSLNVPL